MISRVVRQCGTRFDEASRPQLVTNGKQWWVEDAPHHARMLPAASEQEALDIWDAAVASARPKLHTIEKNHAADRY